MVWGHGGSAGLPWGRGTVEGTWLCLGDIALPWGHRSALGHRSVLGTSHCPGDIALPWDITLSWEHRTALGHHTALGTSHCPGDIALPWGHCAVLGTSLCPGDTALSWGHGAVFPGLHVCPGSDTSAIAVPPATPPRTERGWPRARQGTGQKPCAMASVELGGGWHRH